MSRTNMDHFIPKIKQFVVNSPKFMKKYACSKNDNFYYYEFQESTNKWIPINQFRILPIFIWAWRFCFFTTRTNCLALSNNTSGPIYENIDSELLLQLLRPYMNTVYVFNVNSLILFANHRLLLIDQVKEFIMANPHVNSNEFSCNNVCCLMYNDISNEYHDYTTKQKISYNVVKERVLLGWNRYYFYRDRSPEYADSIDVDALIDVLRKHMHIYRVAANIYIGTNGAHNNVTGVDDTTIAQV